MHLEALSHSLPRLTLQPHGPLFVGFRLCGLSSRSATKVYSFSREVRYRSFTNPLQHPTAAAKQVAVNPSHNSLACNNWSRACCSEAALPTRSGLTWQGRGKAVTAHLSVEGVENGLHQQDVRPTVHQRPHLCIKKAIISRRMPFNEQISLNRRGILAEL